MPRPILGVETRSPSLTVSAGPPHAKTNLSPPQIAQRLRQKRSAAYLASMQRLDAGSHERNAAGLQELLDAISAEFPELGVDERPLGIVSKCFLGDPFEVHICDLAGGIIEHFRRGHSMPPLFERARSLAKHGAYAFIEIYVGTMRAVAADGSVSVLNP
ncbi:MAG TPA: hypothetical protein VJ276_25565 [Thermoanaerobaculia bacterium]|nr:hypothetical protein [Thermoanaerobaculia bacterium]